MNCRSYFSTCPLPSELAYSIFVVQEFLFAFSVCLFLHYCLFEDCCFFPHILKFHDDEYSCAFIIVSFIGIWKALSIRKWTSISSKKCVCIMCLTFHFLYFFYCLSGTPAIQKEHLLWGVQRRCWTRQWEWVHRGPNAPQTDIETIRFQPLPPPYVLWYPASLFPQPFNICRVNRLAAQEYLPLWTFRFDLPTPH